MKSLIIILMVVVSVVAQDTVYTSTRATLILNINHAKRNITVRSIPDSFTIIASRMDAAYKQYIQDPITIESDKALMETDYEYWYAPKDSLKREFRSTLKWIAAVSDTMLYNVMVTKWGKKIADAISQKKIFLGMPREALILSWGDPDDINETVTYILSQEQFVYGELGDGTLVYIVNGKVNSWQDF